MMPARRLKRIQLYLSLLVLYMVFGYLLDVVIDERRSLRYFKQEATEELSLLFYPFYLICRTQCVILYILSIMMSYTAGLIVNYLLCRSMLWSVLTLPHPSVTRNVFEEYLGITLSVTIHQYT